MEISLNNYLGQYPKQILKAISHNYAKKRVYSNELGVLPIRQGVKETMNLP